MQTLDRPRIEYRTPVELVDDVRRGRVRIPPFQRGFKWETADVVALFDSLLRGFPIGNLLFWQQPADAQALQIGPVRVEAAAMDGAYWVVDGQQRITSIVGALTAADTAADTRFRIHLDLDDGAFRAAGVRQSVPQHWLPVNHLVDTSAWLRWMRSRGWLTDGQIERAERAAKALRGYQIPTYIVAGADEGALRVVFERMNRSGKALQPHEVFTALHARRTGDPPDDLAEIGLASAELGFGRLDSRLVLRCVLAYQGGDVFREDFSGEFADDTDRRSTFKAVVETLRHVVELLRGEVGVPHVRLLPYTYVIPVLTRFVRVHGVPTGRAARLLRRWVWRGAVSGLQTRATSVPVIRRAVTAIDGDDPVRSAGQLLAGLPDSQPFVADLTRTGLNHAATRLNLLGMFAAGPRDLRTGEPLDPGSVVEGGNPLEPIVPRGPAGLANRIVHGRARSPVAAALRDAPEDVAASHLVDAAGQELLAAGDLERFLSARADRVAAAIRDHVAVMAEFGARDGQAVTDLLRTAAA